MVVGKPPVRLAKELLHLNPHLSVQPGSDQAAHPVPRINHNLSRDRAGLDSCRYVFHIGPQDFRPLQRPLSFGKNTGFRDLPELLDLFTV